MKFLLIAIMMASLLGCNRRSDSHEIRWAVTTCSEHDGVDYMDISGGLYVASVTCNDGYEAVAQERMR